MNVLCIDKRNLRSTALKWCFLNHRVTCTGQFQPPSLCVKSYNVTYHWKIATEEYFSRDLKFAVLV